MDDFLDFGGLSDWITDGIDDVGTFFGDISTSLFGDTNPAPSPEVPELPEAPVPSAAAEVVPAAEAPAEDLLQTAKSQFEKGPEQFRSWASSLDKNTKAMLGTALKQGAEAALKASAQQNQSEEKRGVEDRKREDTIRRGAVTAVGPSAYTPRPAGIINSRG